MRRPPGRLAPTRESGRPTRRARRRSMTCVEPVVGGAMESQVDEGCGRTKDARQTGSAHDAVRSAVPSEEIEDLLVVPAGMAQLDGDLDPPGELLQEPPQPFVVPFQAGRQLHEKHAATVVELVPRRGDPLDPGFGRIQLLGVGQPPRRFDRHPEPGRQPVPPAGERRLARPPVVARVELDRVELLDVELQALRRRGAGRVQHALPVVIASSGGPDPRHDDSLAPVRRRRPVGGHVRRRARPSPG